MNWRTILLAAMAATLGCWTQPCGALRILALFPLNSKSHNAVCEPLARGLAARGHLMDVYSHYPPKKPIANYQHHSLEGTLRTLTNNMNYSSAVQFQAQNPRDVLDAVGTPSCKLMELALFEKLLKSPASTDPPYDLVIVEAFVADCYLAWGRHLGVPMVGVSTTSILDWYNEAMGNPFYKSITPGTGAGVFVPMNFWERLQNTVMTSFIEFLFSQAMSDQNRMIESLFGPGYPDVADLRRDLDLLIVNSHHSLDGIRPYVPAVVSAAGIHIDDADGDTAKPPQDVQRWLDESKDGCVYFSFGSMIKIESFPQPLLQAFYRAFENIAPVRVLLKIASPKELPPGMPSNVMIQSWFPQLQVLKHKNTKAFVTHGGLLSSEEAIYAGVPMVGIPVFGDQHNNVEINVRKGVATSVQLDAIDEHTLTAAIKDVLYKPSYKQKMEKLSKIFIDRPMKPLDTAIYWVEYVARHGKKCLRSPLADMPWWQANLLDVYGFIASVILVVYHVLKFLIKNTFRMCRRNENRSLSTKVESKKER